MSAAGNANASQGANYRAPSAGVEAAPVLYLPQDLAARIRAAARRAFPNECCGLIEGVAAAGGWRALALHETANLAADPARSFLVDPQIQFDLMRSLRGSKRRVIGCFHSHPNGKPAPSERDRADAHEPGFLWLIAAGNASGFTLSAYVLSETEVAFLPVTLRAP